MDLRCDEVRQLLAPTGSALPLSDERAGQAADHLDRCDECDRELSRRVAEVVDALPVRAGPSIGDVRRRVRDDQRQSFFLRFAAAAAALLIIIGTGWALLGEAPARQASRPLPPPPAPVETPIPDPPKVAELKEVDRNLIHSEGILALYLQFSLSCLNNPTDEDKREFLIRALLVFRESRDRMKARYERGGDPPPGVDTVTRDGLSDALQAMRSSPLPSVKLLPSKITGFKLETPERWHVNHLLGTTPFRLTLATLPSYLSFSYLKKTLGADDALMARIEEALWYDSYVNLPKRQLDKDPQIGPQALEAVLPLLSPRQQKIYRKIAGAP